MNGAARPVTNRTGPPTVNRCGPALLASSPAAPGHPADQSVRSLLHDEAIGRGVDQRWAQMRHRPPTPPPEQRFAARLAARQMSAPTSARTAAVTALGTGAGRPGGLPGHRRHPRPDAGPPDTPPVRCSELVTAVARHRRRDGRCRWSRRPASVTTAIRAINSASLGWSSLMPKLFRTHWAQVSSMCIAPAIRLSSDFVSGEVTSGVLCEHYATRAVSAFPITLMELRTKRARCLKPI